LIWSDGSASLSSSTVMYPRFLARARSFFTDASLRSMRGASPASAVSISCVSFFAMGFRRLIGAGKLRQPVSQSALRLDEPLLFLQCLVGEIPLQPFRCMLQGLFDLLRRSDDLDCSGQIASGAVRVAVAAGEGKAHGSPGISARCSIGGQYGVDAVAIKRCAGEGGVDQV